MLRRYKIKVSDEPGLLCTKGVPVGSRVGPILFQWMYDQVIEDLDKLGIKFQLHYADDSCIELQNTRDFKNKWKRINEIYANAGFELNY